MLAGNVRRSSRRVKPRGEREFLVNSDTLLRDLKVLVGFKIDHPRQTFDIVTSSLDNGNVQSCALRPESHGEWRISHRESSHSRPAEGVARKFDISEGESPSSLLESLIYMLMTSGG